MMKQLNEKVESIKEYAHTHKDKIFLVDLDNKIILCEGDYQDWEELQIKSDEMNSEGGNFRVIIAPKSYIEIQSFDWRKNSNV